MSAIVLHYDIWPFADRARELAKAIAGELRARPVGLDRRPHLGIYDVVVLVLPAVALADPRIQLLAACGELRDKALVLVSDSPPLLAGPLFLELTALAVFAGGARLHDAPLHLGPWLPGVAEQARVRDWARTLANDFPPPTYPRGEPGRRVL